MKAYEDLRAWRDAMQLAEDTYRVSRQFPSDERFGLTAQVRRAAISIASNVAEGQGRETNGEWLQFLGQARGSLYELQTQFMIAARLGYIDEVIKTEVLEQAAVTGRSLSGLIRWVRKNRWRTRNQQPATSNQRSEEADGPP